MNAHYRLSTLSSAVTTFAAFFTLASPTANAMGDVGADADDSAESLLSDNFGTSTEGTTSNELLPEFLMGVEQKKSALAPPGTGSLTHWNYRFDLNLGYRFCRACEREIHAQVGGFLSYPSRLTSGIGKPIQEAGAILGATTSFLSSGPLTHNRNLQGHVLAGARAQLSQTQYARHTLQSVEPTLEVGYEILASTLSTTSKSRHTVLLQLLLGTSGPLGRYTITETESLQNSGETRFTEGPEGPAWRSQGAFSSWTASTKVMWTHQSSEQHDQVSKPREDTEPEKPPSSPPSHYLGAMVAYGERTLQGLEILAGRPQGITETRWTLQLLWQRNFTPEPR